MNGREEPSKAQSESPATARDHLANERTLLAWIRTALTIVGLGFVVARLLVEEEGLDADPGATVIGTALVILGGLTSLVAAARFMRIQRQIEEARFHPNSTMDLLLSGAVGIAALVLAAYLILG